MKSFSMRFVLAGLVVTALTVMSMKMTRAQCSTCPAPTVAYQPVVAQTTVAYRPYTAWYPGKLFDQMRLRRYGVTTAAATPTYTTSYAPYTAGYAPYTAAYQPYVTSYAPLGRRMVARPILQTSYYVPAVAGNHCSTCTQTVARQVVLHPVVASCCHAGCTGCSACSTGVSQASYTQPACSNCAGGAAAPSYTAPQGAATVGPNTGQPALGPNEQVPTQSNYPSLKPTPAPVPESSAPEAAPADSNTLLEAPRLLDPRDRTASRPSVDVWNAVYSQPVTRQAVSQTSYKPTNTDADGWSSVPSNR